MHKLSVFVVASALCVLTAVCSWGVNVGVARADGDREQAHQHFVAGQAKYQSGDLRGAIVEFMAADAIAPSPMLSFNVALCYDKLGDAALAEKMYADYLARRPDAPNRAQVEARISSLKATTAAVAKPVAPAPVQPPPAAAAPSAVPSTMGEPETAPPPPPEDEEDQVPPPPPADEAQTPAPGQAQGQAEQAPKPRRYDRIFAERVPSRNGDASAQQPYSPSQPYAAQQAPYMPQPQQPDETPVYKEWWFWTIVGVGVVGVIVLSHPGTQSNPPVQGAARTSGTAAAPTGLTLFHF